MLKDWNCRLLLYLFQRICSKLVKGKDVAEVLVDFSLFHYRRKHI